jgi:hypothetical protein
VEVKGGMAVRVAVWVAVTVAGTGVSVGIETSVGLARSGTGVGKAKQPANRIVNKMPGLVRSRCGKEGMERLYVNESYGG